jgi:hypothetical protein
MHKGGIENMEYDLRYIGIWILVFLVIIIGFLLFGGWEILSSERMRALQREIEEIENRKDLTEVRKGEMLGQLYAALEKERVKNE